MLTADQLKLLDASKGVEFDRQFLTLMIQHHQGALKMVSDLLAAPPQIAEAHVVAERTGGSRVALAVAPGSSSSGGRPHLTRTDTLTPPEAGRDGDTRDALNLRANRQATARSAFTELVATRQLSPGMVMFALAAAVALGALHALEPGHGKTVVAAYLVGPGGPHATLFCWEPS